MQQGRYEPIGRAAAELLQRDENGVLPGALRPGGVAHGPRSGG